MRRALLSTLTALALVPSAAIIAQTPPAAISVAQAPYPMRTLQPAEMTEDARLYRSALETIHPGLYRYTSKREMDAAFASLERAIRQPMSELDFSRRLSAVLAKIRCNHTKAENTAAFEKWRRDNPSHLPFRFQLIEGRMYVLASDPAQPLLARGTEILAINGRPVAALVKTLAPYVPIDGFTEWSRLTGLASDSDLMGSDFDHFYPYVYGIPAQWQMTVRGSGETVRRDMRMTPITFRQFTALPTDGAKYRSSFKADTKLQKLDDSTMLLTIPTFVNYRDPADPQKFYDAIFTQIKNEKATRLIIDLRSNSGGSGDVNVALMAYLLDRPFRWNHALRAKTIRFGDFPKYIDTWGNRQEIFEAPLEAFVKQPDGWYDRKPSENDPDLDVQQPSPLAFKGRVTLLTSPWNGSGSTMLIAKLKDEGRVRTIGARSGGSPDGPTAGRIFLMTLPNSKIPVRIPNLFNQMNTSLFETGKGLTPDIQVAPTVADMIAGRDPALEAARNDTTPVQNLQLGKLAQTLPGTWTGTLTYRDYSNDEMVTLPTTLSIAPAADNVRLNFSYTYDDGKNKDGSPKIVRSRQALEIDPAARAFRLISENAPASTYRAPALPKFVARGGGTLLMTSLATENDVGVEVRETVSLSARQLVIQRETRRPGEAFRIRHVYRLAKSA
jgi:hypothetical protein